MRIGLDLAEFNGGVRPMDTAKALASVTAAERAGLSTVWVPVLAGGPDPMAVCALAAGAGCEIELATGVVRISGTHPVELARAAFTVADMASSGVILGVGVSHRHVVERLHGIDAPSAPRHLAEYLTVLRSLLDRGEVSFSGQIIRAHAELDRDTANARPIRLGAAAGGPKMLAVAGALADVVITNMAGVRTLTERTVPIAVRAAADADRPAPRIAAVFSVCVSEDVTADRAHIDGIFDAYARIREYRAMLDAEGAERPSDIALIGTEEALTTRLDELADAGVTDLIASVTAPTATAESRTRQFLSNQATTRNDRARHRRLEVSHRRSQEMPSRSDRQTHRHPRDTYVRLAHRRR